MLNHAPILPRQNSAILPNGHIATLYSPKSAPHVQSGVDKSIAELESRIATLRTYEEDFVKLDLDDSRRLLADQIASLETELRKLKKEKSLQSAERLVKRASADSLMAFGKRSNAGANSPKQPTQVEDEFLSSGQLTSR